jgi:hypothetical protein
MLRFAKFQINTRISTNTIIGKRARAQDAFLLLIITKKEEKKNLYPKKKTFMYSLVFSMFKKEKHPSGYLLLTYKYYIREW